MKYQRRLLGVLRKQLERGKSILLVGARQTGKTTLLEEIDADISINLMQTDVRRRYESRPELLGQEIKAWCSSNSSEGKPLVVIDEIQKVPELLDNIQVLIDEHTAQFILTGSSARKLRQPPVNLLPGRVVKMHLDPLMLGEIPSEQYDLDEHLLYGTLPGIIQEKDIENKTLDLQSYVDVYLEEEIRAEALVRKVGDFVRFLELAAAESGYVLNMSKLSNNIGVASSTIESYFDILIDCLVAERIEPLTETKTRRRLLKSNRYLMYDLGVRRIAANEGVKLPEKYLGHLFEQFVGQQLLYTLRQLVPQAKLKFWQTATGMEVDWVVEIHGQYIPIEVKYASAPSASMAKTLKTFIDEYDCPLGGFIICRTPQDFQLTDRVLASSWKALPRLCERIAALTS